MNKLLVLTPLPLEQKFLLEALKEKGHHAEKKMYGPLPVYEFDSLPLRLSLGGHGKTQFALQAQFLIDQFKTSTKALICAGSAGSLDPLVKKYDVVVGTKSIEHDFKVKFSKTDLPSYFASAWLLDLARNFEAASFKVHFGAIAGGDEDILDSERLREIKNLTSAYAVAWEGPGGARAARFSDLSYLEIRGISDLSSTLDLQNFKADLKVAMSNVSEILMKLF